MAKHKKQDSKTPSKRDGRPQSPLSRQAAIHNWAKFQVKGSLGQLRRLQYQGLLGPNVPDFKKMEQDLLQAIEESYQRNKRLLAEPTKPPKPVPTTTAEVLQAATESLTFSQRMALKKQERQ